MADTTTQPARSPARQQVADASDAPDQHPDIGQRSVEKQPRDAPDTTTHVPLYKRPWFRIVATLVGVLLIFFGVRYYLNAKAHETTDNAFIEGDAVRVSPRGGHRKPSVRARQPVCQNWYASADP